MRNTKEKTQVRAAIKRIADVADAWRPEWLESDSPGVLQSLESPVLTSIPCVDGDAKNANESSEAIADVIADATPFKSSDSEFYWRNLHPRNYPTPCPWCGGRLHHNPMCDELRAEWEPTIPCGRHKGKRLSEVPRDYLEWIRATPDFGDNELRESVRLHLSH